MAPVASPSNPYKRHIDAVQRVYDCAKRLKTDHEKSASAPTTSSQQPTLVPATVAEDNVGASEEESDDSWLSESSEEPSDESELEDSDEGSAADDDDQDDDEDDDEDDRDEEEDQDTIVNLRADRGEKPTYKLHDEEVEDIRPFLKDFIPKLKAANEELEAQKKAGTLRTTEIVDEGREESEEQYIEMNLGLGVLEEKQEDTDKAAPESSSSEAEANEEGIPGKETDILGKLMGREKREDPVGIQEIDETPRST